ncbi:hypothetical protein pdam_00000032, partial [Pocillopora damicornis]
TCDQLTKYFFPVSCDLPLIIVETAFEKKRLAKDLKRTTPLSPSLTHRDNCDRFGKYHCGFGHKTISECKQIEL